MLGRAARVVVLGLLVLQDVILERVNRYLCVFMESYTTGESLFPLAHSHETYATAVSDRPGPEVPVPV